MCRTRPSLDAKGDIETLSRPPIARCTPPQPCSAATTDWIETADMAPLPSSYAGRRRRQTAPARPPPGIGRPKLPAGATGEIPEATLRLLARFGFKIQAAFLLGIQGRVLVNWVLVAAPGRDGPRGQRVHGRPMSEPQQDRAGGFFNPQTLSCRGTVSR